MSGRQSTVLKSRPDERPKPGGKRKPRRGLDAFAIAEKQYPSKSGIRQHRLGETEDDGDSRKRGSNEDSRPSKRRRTEDESSSEDGGSDSEGNEWQVGQADDDDDSDIDSDEAIGSDEEEDYDGFAFRGSSTKTNTASKKKSSKGSATKDINLSENDEGLDGDSEDESEDDLGEDAVDLATAWDMNGEESETDTRKEPRDRRKGSTDSTDEDDEDEDDGHSSDASGLSILDEEGGADSKGLSKLQTFVKSMETAQNDAKKSDPKRKVTVEGSEPTDFGVMPSRKLTAADLIPTISDSRLKGSLKHVDTSASSKTTKTGGIPGKLEVPLAKRQQDRIDRTAAYDKSKETLNRWIETVKANRRAEHLSFPLPESNALQDKKIVDTKPRTDLESTIQNILTESGLADSKAENKIQEFEELQAKKVPLEEIQARRAELRKARDLLFREEVRAKRVKKIKSKAYRRVHRKEREKMESKEREALAAAGVDMGEEERERNDRLRAEARMGAKHRESKWAKSLKQTGRTAWDDEARDGMAELARRKEELQHRIEGKRTTGADEEYLSSSSEDSEDEGDATEDGFASDIEKRKLNRKLNQLKEQGDEEADGPYSGLLNMKFMKNAEAARKAENDAEIRQLNRQLAGDGSESEAEAEETGRLKFGGSDAKVSRKAVAISPRQEFEEPDSDDNQAARQSDSDGEIEIQVNPKSKPQPTLASKPSKNGSIGQSAADKPNNETEANPWLSQPSKKGRKRKGPDYESEVTVDQNAGEALRSKPSEDKPKRKNGSEQRKGAKHANNKTLVDDDDSDNDEEEAQVPVLLKNEDLVKRAFAGDEVVASFDKEKIDTIDDEGDKEVDTTLPGWGSWTGTGLSKKDKKRAKQTFETVEGVKPEKRKDAKLDRVIINEKRVKKNVKYLASQLPHPYESKQQYERSLRLPMGPEWTTKNTFQKATKPRIMMKQGIIKPLDKPQI